MKITKGRLKELIREVRAAVQKPIMEVQGPEDFIEHEEIQLERELEATLREITDLERDIDEMTMDFANVEDLPPNEMYERLESLRKKAKMLKWELRKLQGDRDPDVGQAGMRESRSLTHRALAQLIREELKEQRAVNHTQTLRLINSKLNDAIAILNDNSLSRANANDLVAADIQAAQHKINLMLHDME
tara:strand:- start:157 stop:723 length:567 start_codon:yes stop_codon:yes gene_type:complete